MLPNMRIDTDTHVRNKYEYHRLKKDLRKKWTVIVTNFIAFWKGFKFDKIFIVFRKKFPANKILSKLQKRNVFSSNWRWDGKYISYSEQYSQNSSESLKLYCYSRSRTTISRIESEESRILAQERRFSSH